MGARRKARIIAFQAIFSWEINRQSPAELTGFPWLDDEFRSELSEDVFDFSRILTQGTLENIVLIDDLIRKHLDNWDFARLSKVDLAILRMSAYSLVFQKDIPVSVTIDEAIDLAKDFGSDDSYRFVNGVLDGIRKKL
jgi:N utilization substance protein B